jgi:glycosyltransferase involved in cell wall biosynthesis
LQSCLNSLSKQTLEKNKYEIIIVDNNSGDNTKDICSTFCKAEKNATFVTENKQGLSHARNKGLFKSKGDFIAFIDDDAVASPTWCEKILASFKNIRPTPVAVGGQIHPIYEIKPPKWFTDDFEIRTWGNKRGFLQPPKAQNGFSGSNMAFRRSSLVEINGFCPLFGQRGNVIAFGEETHVFRILYKKEPYFWYDPDIIVYHCTPYRNMTIKYRFVRSLKMGKSSAKIEGKRLLSVSSLKACVHIILCAIALLMIIFNYNKEGRIRMAVKKSEQIFFFVGYIVGSL